MNYRLQDFIKYIIPGLYVIFFVFIWSILSSKSHIEYLQLIIPQYFISNKSGIWSLSLIVHSKG